ncbi:hypothetical protein HYS48_04090 [Candidatus Woesearchaeota archaeon]|nr:hypothetical protein [Candidatus Woesearchaeota archaeon]
MREPINPEECHHLDADRLPALVLALHEKYRFTSARDWILLAHKTGGVSCNQHHMAATILQPKPETVRLMEALHKRWYESECGAPASLDEILEYRQQLLSAGVDCNNSYPHFEEGIYPIDCSVEIVRRLASDTVPDNFDDAFIQWKDHLERGFGAARRWHLYILGENSD